MIVSDVGLARDKADGGGGRFDAPLELGDWYPVEGLTIIFTYGVVDVTESGDAGGCAASALAVTSAKLSAADFASRSSCNAADGSSGKGVLSVCCVAVCVRFSGDGLWRPVAGPVL